MGISTKCFEILENRPSNYDLRNDGLGGGEVPPAGGYVPHDPLMSDDESEATDDEEEDDLDGGLGAGDGEDSDSETSEEGHDDSDGDDSFLQDEKKGPKFRVSCLTSSTSKNILTPIKIREILFYENIEIFSARHGRL